MVSERNQFTLQLSVLICQISIIIQIKTHKDCKALRLENEVAISPANLLELKFLLIIMKEGKVIATVPKISCNKNKIILMQFFCFMQHIFISVNMKVHSIMGSLS